MHPFGTPLENSLITFTQINREKRILLFVCFPSGIIVCFPYVFFHGKDSDCTEATAVSRSEIGNRTEETT